MTKIHPAGHRVVVQPFDLDEVDKVRKAAKSVGIILNDEVKERTAVDQGTVIEVGPTAFADEEPWCKVGDTVCFAKYSGKTVEIEKVKFLVLNDEDILCVLED
jgi:co-chaperonin GroES (HSP10)